MHNIKTCVLTEELASLIMHVAGQKDMQMFHFGKFWGHRGHLGAGLGKLM